MKNIIFFGLLCLTVLSISCSDNSPIPEVNLPETIELGLSEIYLNGEKQDGFTSTFHEDTVNNQMIFGFRQLTEKNILNGLGFSFLPVSEGKYIIHEQRELYLGAYTTFRQSVDEEHDGWVYKIENIDTDFFEIESLDQTSLIAKGKFQVHLIVDEKNGLGDSGLPNKIRFDGIFHEKYMRD